MKTALVIMAAGIGSRFGEGIKQLAKVDDHGHIIMDYSIHDALEAGFDKVIFIIRKDIEKEFKEIIGDRIEKEAGIEVAYAYQDLKDIPGKLPEGRTKPWGTGQAVLAARELIDTPFCVINADDYYGKEGYKLVHDYLVAGNTDYCMAGFILKNTLSDNGGVTRGVCRMQDGYLTEVEETSNIVKTEDGAAADGKAVDIESLVSMNMWGFTPEFVKTLEAGFKEFFETKVPGNPMKAEYLIPVYIGELLQTDTVKVRVLKSHDSWYGMTYKEDVASVTESFKQMVEAGKYKEELFSDLKK